VDEESSASSEYIITPPGFTAWMYWRFEPRGAGVSMLQTLVPS
jgi:hypothetical protein